jgi:hypothetical protein
MSAERVEIRLHARVSKSEAAAIEQFRIAERLPTQAEAVRLLVEIGLDTVSKQGHRFWDRKPDEPLPT